MNKNISPAAAEHVMQENVRLRGLLRRAKWKLWTSPGDTLRAEIEAALSQQAEPQKSCKWTRDDDTGAYETACGVTWHLSDGGEPEEHGQYFCHHCGKRIDDEGADHE